MKSPKDQVSEEIIILKRNIKTGRKPKILFSPTPGFNSNPVIPSEPKDDLGIKFYKTVKSFVSSNAVEIDFPLITDTSEKYRIHCLAEEFNLNHFKRGTNQKKFVTLQKRNCLPVDQFQYIGYIGLFGPQVEYSARLVESVVPFSCLQQCFKRDGPIRHITLMLKQDIMKSIKRIPDIPEYYQLIDHHRWRDQKLECLMDLISLVIEDDWKDLGLGTIANETTSSFFKCVEWPSAYKFRRNLGLEDHDFNITIGFKSVDIHDIPKNRSTLVKPMLIKPIPYLKEMMQFLDYLEIDPYHCRTIVLNGWNIHNIQFLQQQDLKDFGFPHEAERVLLNFLCNYRKNMDIYDKRRREKRYI